MNPMLELRWVFVRDSNSKAYSIDFYHDIPIKLVSVNGKLLHKRLLADLGTVVASLRVGRHADHRRERRITVHKNTKTREPDCVACWQNDKFLSKLIRIATIAGELLYLFNLLMLDATEDKKTQSNADSLLTTKHLEQWGSIKQVEIQPF